MKKLLMILSFLMMFSFTACKTDAPKDEVKENESIEETETKDSSKEKADSDKDEKETTSSEKDDYYPVTIKSHDVSGNEIELTFDKMPEKVLAVYQSPVDNLLALGLADKIVYAAALDVPVKDEYKTEFEKIEYNEKAPSKEAVLEMEPDMIISWSSYFGDKKLGDVGFWHDKGVKTYIIQNSGLLPEDTLEHEYEDIMNLGIIFNKVDQAQKLIDDMKAEFDRAKEHIKDKEPVTALILETEKEGQYRNYGAKTIGGQIAQEAGAKLVMEGRSFGNEELIEKNPEVIFAVYFAGFMEPEEAVKAITENPALQSLDAVKNGRVLPIMLSEVYAAGVRAHDGINTIINGLYPELN